MFTDYEQQIIHAFLNMVPSMIICEFEEVGGWDIFIFSRSLSLSPPLSISFSLSPLFLPLSHTLSQFSFLIAALKLSVPLYDPL